MITWPTDDSPPTIVIPAQQPEAPVRTVSAPRISSSGGGGNANISEGFTAFASIATALTPLVSLFSRPKTQRQTPARRPRPAMAIRSASEGMSQTAKYALIGGGVLLLLVVGIAVIKK